MLDNVSRVEAILPQMAKVVKEQAVEPVVAETRLLTAWQTLAGEPRWTPRMVRTVKRVMASMALTLVVAIAMTAAAFGQAVTVQQARMTAGRASLLAQGQIVISPSQPFTSINGVYVSETMYVAVVNGAFTVDLEPTPAGIFYIAKAQLEGSAPVVKRWFVYPTETTLSLFDVEMGVNWLPMAWRGAWSSALPYSVYDMVSYSGSSYMAIAPSRAVAPGDTTKWSLLAAKGTDGADGVSSYTYVAYAADASGTSFTTTFDATLNYIAIKTVASPITSPGAGDFTGLWKNYKGATGSTGAAGAAGASSYTYVAYAADASGTSFTTTFDAALDYIAIKTVTTAIPSPGASDFTGLWKNYKGATGATGASGSTGPLASCVGTPGNTTAAYKTLCEVPSTGALWACVNASGCTVTADWAQAGGNVAASGARTLNAITVYDASGNLVASGCSVAAGVLTCGTGTVSSGITLPELTSNGSDSFAIYGKDSQAASVCIIMPDAAPTSGYALTASSSTATTTDGRTCTIMQWSNAGSAPPSGTGFAIVSSGAWATPRTLLTSDLPPDYLLTATSGSGTAYTGTLPSGVTISSYVLGEQYTLIVDTANTGASTVAFGTAGAVSIKKVVGGVTTALASGDMCAGLILVMRYDGTNMQAKSQLCASSTGPTIPTTSSMLKGDGAGNAAAATAGTDYMGISTVLADAQLPAKFKTGAGCFDIGADNTSSDLADADIGPQGRIFMLPVAGTITEVTVAANAGTPSVILRKNHAGTATDLVSGALATNASGAVACAATGSACLDGTAKSGSISIVTAGSANVVAAGDWIETKTGSGFASSGAKRLSVCLVWGIN